MQRKTATTSKLTKIMSKNLKESLLPKVERFTKATSAVMNGKYYIKEKDEWIEVKEKK